MFSILLCGICGGSRNNEGLYRPRYRLVCICFPPPGRGLPYGSGLGLSRCLGPGECLHSYRAWSWVKSLLRYYYYYIELRRFARTDLA